MCEHQDIMTELRKNKVNGQVNGLESRVYNLTVDPSNGGVDSELFAKMNQTEFKVVPRQLQMHPVRNQVICLNFLRYWPGRIISIPLKYINEDLSPAIKRGAFIIAQNRWIDCIVEDGAVVPEFIEVKCEELLLKNCIKLDRIIKPEGVTWGPKVKDNFIVGSVFGRAKAMVAE